MQTINQQQQQQTSTVKVNVPKSPKPQRTLAIFEHVTIGLK